jgi:hypothetical protein
MAVSEDRMAEIKAAFGEYKHYVDTLKASHADEIAAKNAEIAEAQKKLQDAVDSSVSLESFNAFADEHLAAIKGAMA